MFLEVLANTFYFIPVTSSSNAFSGFFESTTPDATSTPTAPSSIAFFTSSPFFIPAPTITWLHFFPSHILNTDSVIISGFAVDTETSPPISSGGSTATKFGVKEFKAFPVVGSFAQTIVVIPIFLAVLTIFSISSILILFSE